MGLVQGVGAISAQTNSQPGSPSGTDPDITTALALGWQMAETFVEVRDLTRPAPVAPDDLPGMSALGSRQLIHLRFKQVIAALSNLNEKVTASGLSVDEIKASATDVANRVMPPDGDDGPDLSSDGLRSEVLDLHVRILEVLTAADASIGKAYGLGRALADLTLRPTESSREAFLDDFEGRVDIMQGWLRELKTLLPDHAAAAVQISLDLWNGWITNSSKEDSIWKAEAPWKDGLHPTATLSLATNTLYVQGTRWRSVLTHEMNATDVLNTNEYIKAGEALFQRVGAIGRRFVRQYWYVLTAGVLVVGGVVAALLRLHGGSGGGLGALGTIAAAAGLSWKGVQSSFGTAVGKAEPALWGAELDLAIATGITILPGASTVEMEIPKVKTDRPRVIVTEGASTPETIAANPNDGGPGEEPNRGDIDGRTPALGALG